MTDHICNSVLDACRASFPRCPHNEPHAPVEDDGDQDSWQHCAPATCREANGIVRCVRIVLPEIDALVTALKLAADALDIAADWNVDRMDIETPVSWGMPAGFCDTRAIARKLREAALAPFEEVES